MIKGTVYCEFMCNIFFSSFSIIIFVVPGVGGLLYPWMLLTIPISKLFRDLQVKIFRFAYIASI